MAQCSMLSGRKSTFSPASKLDAHSLVDELGKVDGALLRVGHLVGGISRSSSHFDRGMASHVFPHIIFGCTTASRSPSEQQHQKMLSETRHALSMPARMQNNFALPCHVARALRHASSSPTSPSPLFEAASATASRRYCMARALSTTSPEAAAASTSDRYSVVTRDLRVQLGKREVLRGIDVRVKRGQLHMLLGAWIAGGARAAAHAARLPVVHCIAGVAHPSGYRYFIVRHVAHGNYNFSPASTFCRCRAQWVRQVDAAARTGRPGARVHGAGRDGLAQRLRLPGGC